MAYSRRQFAFDLITEKESPLYKYYSSRSGAYDAIKRFMKENGCEHRQYSVYTSNNKMGEAEVSELIIKICEKLPWLSECTRRFDVTDIGEKHDLIGDISEACEVFKDKRREWEEKVASNRATQTSKNNLLNIYDYKDAPLFGALIELNDRLINEDIWGIELNVVGGFAMMTHGLRDKDGITDVDYIGDELPKKIVEIADEIGIKYNLGRHWINNDVLLAGATLEDLEFSTGKLHFQEAFELETMKINILDTRDLLKMKVIAIDTALSAVEVGDADFTRAKDFNDIEILKKKLHINNLDIKTALGEKLLSKYTIKAIKAFEIGGMEAVKKDILPLAARYNNKKPQAKSWAEYNRSSYIENILKNAGISGGSPPNKPSPEEKHRSGDNENR
ncbi:MAG: hypothetical protein K6G10_03995 [Butyrivibrio sp.]|nr:hypothetical protein [Butyrivibrio sp.]